MRWTCFELHESAQSNIMLSMETLGFLIGTQRGSVSTTEIRAPKASTETVLSTYVLGDTELLPQRLSQWERGDLPSNSLAVAA